MAAALAWTGFEWSGVTGTMRFAAREGRWFWANGEAWGMCEQQKSGDGVQVRLQVLYGSLTCRHLEIIGVGKTVLDTAATLQERESLTWQL